MRHLRRLSLFLAAALFLPTALVVAGRGHATAQPSPLYTQCQSVYSGASPSPVRSGASLTIVAGATCPIQGTQSTPPGQAARFSLSVLEPGSAVWTPATPAEPGTSNEGRTIVYHVTATGSGTLYYSVTVTRSDNGYSQQTIGFVQVN